MTFAIAEILHDDRGRITMLADTKLTNSINEAATRQIYTQPCLKVVVVNEDVVVAIAGDTPETAMKFAAQLRGKSSVAQMVESLRQYSAHYAISDISKSFLIAKRAPDPKLWRIVGGRVDDSADWPRLWIGDRAAFSAFRQQRQAALLDQSSEFRLVAAMQAIVAFDDIPTVGGYITRVSGDRLRPFRFHGDQTSMAPWTTEWTVAERDGRRLVKIGVPDGYDPSGHHRIAIPGTDDTFAALAFVIPEICTAWLWTHAHPWQAPIKLSGIRSMDELVRIARDDWGQMLAPDL